MHACAICVVTESVRHESGKDFAKRWTLQQYLRNRRGFMVAQLLKLYGLGALQRRVKMPLNDPAYNWVIFLLLNAVSTVLFSIL